MELIYECDPNKNTICSKTACSINGGPCKNTTDYKYAKQPVILEGIIKMTDELEKLTAKEDELLKLMWQYSLAVNKSYREILNKEIYEYQNTLDIIRSEQNE